MEGGRVGGWREHGWLHVPFTVPSPPFSSDRQNSFQNYFENTKNN